MAYRRRNYRRKTYRRKTYRRKRAPPKDDVWAVAKGAWNIGKKVLRLINVEHKHKVNALSTSVSTTGICVPLFHNDATYTYAVSQGDTHNTRDGNSIKPLNLTFKSTLFIPSTTTSPAKAETVRMIIFKHEQNNGQTVALTDYLQTNNVRDFKNYDNRFQFKTLLDKTINLSVAKQPIVTVNFNKKLFGHMTYSSGSDDIETGAYYLILLSTTSGAGNMPEFRGHWRMSYTDN